MSDKNKEKINTKDILARQKAGRIFTKTGTILFLIIMAFVIVVPFYWMLNTSFKTSNEAERPIPTLYPHKFTLENYKIALMGQRLYTLEQANNFIKAYPKKEKALNDYLSQNENEYKASFKQYDLIVNDDSKVYTPEYLKIKPILESYDGIQKRRELLLKQNSQYLVKQSELDKVVKNLKEDIKTLQNTIPGQTNPSTLAIMKAKLAQFKSDLNLNEILLTNNINVIKTNNKEINDIELKLNNKTQLQKYQEAKKVETQLQNNNQIYNQNFLKLRNIVVPYRKAEKDLKILKADLQKAQADKQTSSIVTPGSANENFGIFLLNTLIVGIASTILGTFISIIGAFALSRLSFKGRDLVFSIMLATMMIPGEMMVISNYITVTKLGWNDDNPAFKGAAYFAMIVPFLVTVFHIYLLRQNFKQIPSELYYAAKVDGTSDWKYLWKIMVPLAKSSIITIVILKLMGTWNAYIWPNLVAPKHKLITVWLRSAFTDKTGRTAVEQQMAGTVIVLIPLLLVFIFLRKYIMRGVSRGGTKG